MRSLLAAIRAAMCAAGVPACVVLTIVRPVVAQPATTQDKDIEALAKKSGCLECHSVDRTVKGPSYHEVAARYKGNPGARDLLIQKVKNGGKGNWTEITHGIPMPPHSRILSAAEIERLVDWVLSR